MFRRLARLFVFIYQIFFLLGLHRRYLYKTDIEDQNTDGSKGTTSQAPRVEYHWEQVLRERSQYFAEHYTPLLLNGSAFYLYVIFPSDHIRVTGYLTLISHKFHRQLHFSRKRSASYPPDYQDHRRDHIS